MQNMEADQSRAGDKMCCEAWGGALETGTSGVTELGLTFFRGSRSPTVRLWPPRNRLVETLFAAVLDSSLPDEVTEHGNRSKRFGNNRIARNGEFGGFSRWELHGGSDSCWGSCSKYRKYRYLWLRLEGKDGEILQTFVLPAPGISPCVTVSHVFNTGTADCTVTIASTRLQQGSKAVCPDEEEKHVPPRTNPTKSSWTGRQSGAHSRTRHAPASHRRAIQGCGCRLALRGLPCEIPTVTELCRAIIFVSLIIGAGRIGVLHPMDEQSFRVRVLTGDRPGNWNPRAVNDTPP